MEDPNKRTWSQDLSSSLKRPRTTSFNILDESMATPSRLACLKKRAKAKGMATPSPGRAHGALAMLHFTNSFNKRHLKERPSQTLGAILQKYLKMFGKEVQSLNVKLVAARLGCQVEPILNLAQILQVFGVARFNSSTDSLLWIGTDSIDSSIDDIVQLSHASTSTSYAHLTRKAVALYVQYSANGTCSNLTLGNIALFLQRQEDNVALDRLHNISSVLVTLALAQPIKTETSSSERQNYCYKWIGPIPLSISAKRPNATPPFVFRTAFSSSSFMQPTFSGPCRFNPHSNITPIESMIKPTVKETPQSVVNMRKTSRAAVRNAMRSVIETHRKEVDSGRRSYEIPSCSLNSGKPTKEKQAQYIKITLGPKDNGSQRKRPTILATRESAASVKKTGVFKFSGTGMRAIGLEKNISPTLFCHTHIFKQGGIVKKASSFRSAVLLSTPEMREAKTRSAIKEHLKDSVVNIKKGCFSEGSRPVVSKSEITATRNESITPYFTAALGHPVVNKTMTSVKIQAVKNNNPCLDHSDMQRYTKERKHVTDKDLSMPKADMENSNSQESFEVLTQDTATSSIFNALKRDFSITSNISDM